MWTMALHGGAAGVPDPVSAPRFIDLSQYLPWRRGDARLRTRIPKEDLMLDIFMLALGLGFFAVAVGYAYACERL
jgi:hypothetical protein